MARSYHNIDRALPSKSYRYIGWDSHGNTYYIKKWDTGMYRAAQALALNGTVPYFYARTLKEVSATLEAIN